MDLITIARKGARQFDIGVRGHHVATDLAEKEGGRDEGPTPVELMAGSLGACIAVMIQAMERWGSLAIFIGGWIGMSTAPSATVPP